MLDSLVPALGFGFIAGIMPGPLQSFLLLQTLRHGPRGGAWILPAPLLSDGPIIVVCLAVLSQAGSGLLRGLALCGGLFLIYLAWESWRALRADGARPDARSADEQISATSAGHSGRALLVRAALINGLGPGPWIFWGTVMGPLLIQQWRLSPGRGLAFLGGFYGTLIALLALQLALFTFARRLGPRIARGGSWLGRALLLVFAALLILYGLGAIDRFGL
ncbi:MAG: LysE family transporter [bacterium]|nr:LysE family transporter [bacterium]